MTRSRVGRRALALSGGFLLVIAISAVACQTIAPEAVERTVQELHRVIGSGLQERDGAGLPIIALGPPGGEPELDRCPAAFVEMIPYRAAGVLPTYAAHNVCGGDIILGWSLGQRVRIKGDPGSYEVVDIVSIPKGTATVADLRGVHGSMTLQTCYYGVQRMRLVGLAPVPPSESVG